MAAFTALAISSAIGAGFSIYNQIKAGKQEKKAGEAQRAVAESQAELIDFNASVADQQAADALARGAQEEQRFRQGINGIIGAQRAAAAGSNVDVGFGSALDVQADAAFLGELDALNIRTNAAREAWGYDVEAYDTRRRAEITRREGVMLEAQGGQRARQAYLGAVQTGIGYGTSLLQMRYGFNNQRAGA